MAEDLSGKRIAFLVAQEGVEEVELTKPWQAVQQAGAPPELIAPAAVTCRRSSTSTSPRPSRSTRRSSRPTPATTTA